MACSVISVYVRSQTSSELCKPVNSRQSGQNNNTTRGTTTITTRMVNIVFWRNFWMSNILNMKRKRISLYRSPSLSSLVDVTERTATLSTITIIWSIPFQAWRERTGTRLIYKHINVVFLTYEYLMLIMPRLEVTNELFPFYKWPLKMIN